MHFYFSSKLSLQPSLTESILTGSLVTCVKGLNFFFFKTGCCVSWHCSPYFSTELSSPWSSLHTVALFGTGLRLLGDTCEYQAADWLWSRIKKFYALEEGGHSLPVRPRKEQCNWLYYCCLPRWPARARGGMVRYTVSFLSCRLRAFEEFAPRVALSVHLFLLDPAFEEEKKLLLVSTSIFIFKTDNRILMHILELLGSLLESLT